jgi:hypothetical protein
MIGEDLGIGEEIEEYLIVSFFEFSLGRRWRVTLDNDEGMGMLQWMLCIERPPSILGWLDFIGNALCKNIHSLRMINEFI